MTPDEHEELLSLAVDVVDEIDDLDHNVANPMELAHFRKLVDWIQQKIDAARSEGYAAACPDDLDDQQ